jgi:hypothetical protein
MRQFSTRNLTGFYDPELLRRAMQAAAMLDVVLEPDDESLRTNFFTADWSDGVDAANMDDSGGDHLWILFSRAGTVIKGFAHESELSPFALGGAVWPSVYNDTPAELLALLEDAAIEKDAVSFCIWRAAGDEIWRTGGLKPARGEDGSEDLLQMLLPTARKYHAWAEENWERELPLAPIKRVYQSLSLNEKDVAKLNPDAEYSLIAEELQSILGAR